MKRIVFLMLYFGMLFAICGPSPEEKTVALVSDDKEIISDTQTNTEDDFSDDIIIAILKKNDTEIADNYNIPHGIDYKEIIELTKYTQESLSDLDEQSNTNDSEIDDWKIEHENYRRIIAIRLSVKDKQNVINSINSFEIQDYLSMWDQIVLLRFRAPRLAIIFIPTTINGGMKESILKIHGKLRLVLAKSKLESLTLAYTKSILIYKVWSTPI
ncbi:MAG: hypothetical protein LBR37_00710 [Erysipelotrichaceae bacterium]|jgi:hypothetical protein|nr:hypothetical protein [Erysipelotrichaceae bacterium]